jgi:MoaA/NifB/PqqE/SkfB family radical SAM enzyme
MRFPLRLTADLALGVAVRALGFERHSPLISALAQEAAAPAPSPLVWIAGGTPLDDPQVARVANNLTAAGRYVFLPADSVLLRRRIHEFRPSSRLYFTLRFDGTQSSHDRFAGRQGAFQSQLEGIRVAKLSGFLICADLILHSDNDAVELATLHGELRKLDLDGFLISPAEPTTELERRAIAARRRLLSRRWALLSRLLDSAILPGTSSATSAQSVQAPDATIVELQPANFEEGAQAP